MINFKLSSKMHIMIAVSVAIVVLGIAMGLIFQFASNGYFNYGADYSSYNCVEVEYVIAEYSESAPVKEICDKEFKNAGVSYYTATEGDNTLTYKFSTGVKEDKLQTAVKAIQDKFNENGGITTLSSAQFHKVETELGGSKALTFGAIALASAVVFQFLYFVIRYGLTSALAALLADVHNLAIFVSLLAITRVPVGSTVFTFGILTVLITMIGCCFLFDKVRKNVKDEEFAKLGVFEQVDNCANDNIVNIAVTAIAIAAVSVLLFVFMAISALSAAVIVTPVILALLSTVSGIYGTAFFTPSVYSRFKQIGDKFKADHSKKSKNKNS